MVDGDFGKDMVFGGLIHLGSQDSLLNGMSGLLGVDAPWNKAMFSLWGRHKKKARKVLYCCKVWPHDSLNSDQVVLHLRGDNNYISDISSDQQCVQGSIKVELLRICFGKPQLEKFSMIALMYQCCIYSLSIKDIS